jgi:hypothetical protein
MKIRLPDLSEIRALEFKGKFRRFGICSVSTAIGIDWSILDAHWLNAESRVGAMFPGSLQHDQLTQASLTRHQRMRRPDRLDIRSLYPVLAGHRVYRRRILLREPVEHCLRPPPPLLVFFLRILHDLVDGGRDVIA